MTIHTQQPGAAKRSTVVRATIQGLAPDEHLELDRVGRRLWRKTRDAQTQEARSSSPSVHLAPNEARVLLMLLQGPGVVPYERLFASLERSRDTQREEPEGMPYVPMDQRSLNGSSARALNRMYQTMGRLRRKLAPLELQLLSSSRLGYVLRATGTVHPDGLGDDDQPSKRACVPGDPCRSMKTTHEEG